MIKPVRSLDEATAFIDWTAATLRWAALFGFALALAIDNTFSTYAGVALLIAGLLNVFLSILARLNRRVWGQPAWSVTIDLIVAGSLYYLSGGMQGNLGWVGLLPLFSAGLYYGVRGALLLVAIILVGLAGFGLMTDPPLQVAIYTGVWLLLYIPLGSLVGFLSERIRSRISSAQRAQLQARREAEKTEAERRRAIYTLISALNASLNYQRVLETALDMSANVLAGGDQREDRLVSAVLLFSDNENNTPELVVGSARRLTPSDMRIGLPGTSGVLGHAIDEAEPRLERDLAKDPELSRIVAVRSCQSAYVVPLRVNLDTYGVLLFAHPNRDYFNAERREVLDIVGNQAVIAIQNARLYHDLELEKERMMEIQEEARKKLARDLHDGPTQSVAALAMRVNFARRMLDRDPKAAADELYKIEDLARRTTKEIRHMLFTLRPLVLESQGLIAALDSMAEKMKETYNQNVIVSGDPKAESELEAGKQGVIFYIAEEAVNNARKHAHAPHIWVRLKQAGPELTLLEIEDDGLGFDLASVDGGYEKRGSLGMVNMRERTELVNGVLQLESTPGRGTCVRLWIPLSEQAADQLRRGA